MAGILRTWVCQNKNCRATFDAWEDYPKCPTCRCVRTAWLPAGGNIIGAARTADRELRALADAYGMTNINTSAREGERAMPALKQRPAVQQSNLQQFGPGFVAPPYQIDSAGQVRGVCVPSAVNVNFKVKAPVGRAFAQRATLDPRANTIFEGRSK
jgi:hypothetical protein